MSFPKTPDMNTSLKPEEELTNKYSQGEHKDHCRVGEVGQSDARWKHEASEHSYRAYTHRVQQDVVYNQGCNM